MAARRNQTFITFADTRALATLCPRVKTFQLALMPAIGGYLLCANAMLMDHCQ